MAERLNGKCAVVTGAASGMGKAISLAYLREGAQIVAADIHESRLMELEKEAAELGYGERFRWVRCDVTSGEDCANAIRTCVDAFGVCNVLSHNAGITDDFTMVSDLNDESWDKLIAVNLTGSMKIARAALKYFLAHEIKASMVMVTSNSAVESATGGPAYTASKAGANALMKAIAFEYGRNGIRCNAIAPGAVMSNIMESAPVRNPAGADVHMKTGYNAHSSEWTIIRVTVPEDIAPLAVYLASDESRFMQGATLLIDGGVALG